MNFQIMNFVNPSRVRMIWQSPTSSERRKFHVGDLIRAGDSVSLFYNWNSADWALAGQAGFQGHPAFSPSIAVHHTNVLEIIRRRLPPKNRRDYPAFLFKYGLSQWSNITDIALIGYTGARLPGDGFSFEIDFSIEQLPFEFFFEISGFRYYQGMHLPMEALLNQPLMFRPEPTNMYDPNALEILLGDWKIGYVPRSLSPQLKLWLQFTRMGAWIARIEGAAARPNVYIYVAVEKVAVANQPALRAFV